MKGWGACIKSVYSFNSRYFTYEDLIPCEACAADVAIIFVLNAVINYLGITTFFILLCTSWARVGGMLIPEIC
jgi:hypothetical protein